MVNDKLNKYLWCIYDIYIYILIIIYIAISNTYIYIHKIHIFNFLIYNKIYLIYNI